MKHNKKRYYIAMTLSAVMVLNTMPIFADEVKIEVSEYIHDEDCNHTEGQLCIHEHTVDCTTLTCMDETEEHSHSDECFELNCTHLHNADCEYVEARECSCMNQDADNNQINCTLTEGCNQLSEHEGECETLDKQQGIKVNNWVFNDADNLNEGVLALPGVNSTNQIDLETLVNMLPKSISMLEGDRSELDIISWNCPEFVLDEEGNWPSSSEYIFTAELPEGYDFELMPSIKVSLGGAELYDISQSEGVVVGDFTVIGDGSKYEWNDPVLTIKSETTLTIKNTNPNEPTKHRIVVVPKAMDVNITLDGVNIDLSSYEDEAACAFDMTGATVNLTLAKESRNVLKSDSHHGGSAGITVPHDAELTIGGFGYLEVSADSGAGIGSNSMHGMSGTIIIKDSAQVRASSGVGAGIGGGLRNKCGTVKIQDNATVVAESMYAAGIGGGLSGDGGNVEISGKGVQVLANGSLDIGSLADTNTATLSVTNGATLKYNNNGTNANSPLYENCTIIYSNGTKIQYDENGIVVPNLSLTALLSESQTYPRDVTLTAVLTGAVDGNEGKTIKLVGNGEHTVSTNDQGIATHTFEILSPGTYTFTATFAGDDKNKEVSASITITVTSTSSSGVTTPKNSYQSTSETINQTLSSYNLKSLIRNKKNLTLSSSKVSMSFEPAALEAILAAIPTSARSITITAVPKKENVNLNGSYPVYDFTISYKDKKGKNVLVNVDFPKGSASIAINHTLGANEKSESLFIVTIDEKRNVTWLDQSSYKNGKVIADVEHYSIYGIAYKTLETTYTDIVNHWAKSDIEYGIVRGLYSDTGNQMFSPDASMTQEMLATALKRLNGIEPKAYIKDYKPDAYLTREQMAVIITDYMKESGYTIPTTLKAVKYADQKLISTKARGSVKTMQQAGIIKGKAGNLYDPQAYVTKGEGAAMLHRLIEVMIEPSTANGWQKNDSGQRMYYEKGKALTGWQTLDKLTYYFNENGEMYEGWKLHKNKWYYWNKDGAVIGWKFINRKWYYFESDGVMASSTWVEGYELGTDGAMKTNH